MRKVLTSLVFILMFLPLMAWATGGAIISNGTIEMGVHNEGHLNIPYENDPLGIGYMGLRYIPTGAASTEPGCQCEGWGVGDNLTGSAGFANESSDGGAVNMTLVSFTSTASTATSVVRVNNAPIIGGDEFGPFDIPVDIFEVTHEYKPSVTPYLYEVNVTIENLTDSNVEVLYRRVMDWDIYPTPFDEYVTISDYAVGNLIRTDTNGFNSANPFSFDSYQPGPVTDAGPDDHGALFDFNFGILGQRESKTFKTFYGAAPTESAAYAALVAVGAEIYSFGQPDVPGGPELGIPNTFIFAFQGVGAPPVENPVPEPSTILLLGAGLLGLGILSRRKN